MFCLTLHRVYALHTLLMMTPESMLSKRPVLRFTAASIFLLNLFPPSLFCFRLTFTVFRNINKSFALF